MQTVVTLDDYLNRYGALLGKQAQESLRPLHVPGRDAPSTTKFLRTPFEAQAHCIMAASKTLDRNNSALIVAECGTGKTLMGMCAFHEHARGKPYRGIVMCPPHLPKKWQREVEQTLPGVKVFWLQNYRDVTKLQADSKPTCAEWYVVTQSGAKLAPKWLPAVTWYRPVKGAKYPTCPKCGKMIVTDSGAPMDLEKLGKKRSYCSNVGEDEKVCGEALWTWTHDVDRWPISTYVNKKLKGYFNYLLVDELHQQKSANSAQANAMGALCAATRKTIGMTGTLIAGQADHIRPILFRLSPRSLVAEGFKWNDVMAFSDLYGKIETRITTTERGESDGDDNRNSRGGTSRSQSRYVRPGIMPTLFGRHLIDKTIFLSLEDISDELPELYEDVIGVPMDGEQSMEYAKVEDELLSVVKDMARNGDRRLLGAMLQTLLAYPDYPYGWEQVGYDDKGTFRCVTEPENLDPAVIRPKEAELIRIVKEEWSVGRQSWVFVQFTDSHDVARRLEGLLANEGLRVKILRSSVDTSKREEWITKNCKDVDVVISHPQVVETGLDLFDKGGNHNFSTLIFYETGYNLSTLRQASRRSWRIGQQSTCKVFYLYYKGTIQEKAMALMGKKLTAAEALEGKFSGEGLAAMAGDEGSVEMALAKSLSSKVPDDPTRSWSKVCVPFRKVARDFFTLSAADLAAELLADDWDDDDDDLDVLESLVGALPADWALVG